MQTERNVFVAFTVAFLIGLAIPDVTASFSDLENFIRVLGSLDPKTSTVNYINGSVFIKHADMNLKKIFNYEGYSINRKLRQDDGSFLSLAREFVVYRDPVTSAIIQIWINPLTNKSNEVFHVANDPVNMVLDRPFPSFALPENNTLYTVYNSTIVIGYPNPLSPEAYPGFSAGPLFRSIELLGVFVNFTLMQISDEDSLPVTGSWIRKSDFLPWMELGTTSGSLYYNAFVWKCNEGISCVADDILEFVNKVYPDFTEAPKKAEKQNQNSWTSFKKIVDERREAGLPDINIPILNATSNPNPESYALDKRVEYLIYYAFPIAVTVVGTGWADIPGKPAIPLFDIKGTVSLDFQPLTRRDGYRMQLDGAIQFFNYTDKRLLVFFDNPFTGKSRQVVNITGHCPVETSYLFENDAFYTIDISSSKMVGLAGATSVEKTPLETDPNRWSINMFNFLFPNEELEKDENEANFFGSINIFRSWPAWLEMEDTPGNLMITLTMAKEVVDKPDWDNDKGEDDDDDDEDDEKEESDE